MQPGSWWCRANGVRGNRLKVHAQKVSPEHVEELLKCIGDCALKQIAQSLSRTGHIYVPYGSTPKRRAAGHWEAGPDDPLWLLPT